MLPCQNRCSHYQEGCHKTCASWKEYQRQNALDRQRKKAYLKYYAQLCSTIVHQCH